MSKSLVDVFSLSSLSGHIHLIFRKLAVGMHQLPDASTNEGG